MAERRLRALSVALLIGVALPAGVTAAPESLLPEGFGTPPPPRAPAPSARPTPRAPPGPTATPRPAQAPVSAPAPSESGDSVSDPAPPPAPSPPPPLDAGRAADRVVVYQRGADVVGALGPDEGGVAFDGFGEADGRFLVALLDATHAPLTSRWQQIVARRALLSRVPTPKSVRAADWVGARAFFLARSGEADAARVLVSAIDPERLTPGFSEAAMLTALANADPSGLCPYAPFVTGRTPTWRMAQAVCAGLAGEPGRAVALIEQARRAAGGRRTPDLLLAEKVLGAAANGRRAVRMRWDNVTELTPWRFGMAQATAATVPAALWEDAPDEIRAWGARAPLLDDAQRLPLARTAAILGAFSASDLVTSYSSAAETSEGLPDELGTAVDQLRTSYVGEDAESRLAAMRTLWGSGANTGYGDLILTAYAAARLVPDEALVADADRIVASLFTAGLDLTAARWARIVDADGSDATDGAWAILAVGAPETVVDGSQGRVERFVERQDERRAAMLVAALAGLGRLDLDDARSSIAPTGFALDTETRWSRLLTEASGRNQPGTVIVLASAGMQVRDWSDLPPAHLYHILSAYRRAGLDGAARMIAAEAVTRS